MVSKVDITVIMVCKDRLSHVKESLPFVLKNEDIETIFVDYSCSQESGKWVSKNHPSVKIVYSGYRKFFNLSEARNLGANVATNNILVFIDADNIVPRDFAKTICSEFVDVDFMGPDGGPAHTLGLLACTRDIFNKVGGYDEVFLGWGGEDIDIRQRFKRLGARYRPLETSKFNYIEHDQSESALGERHPLNINDKKLAMAIAYTYMEVKFDVEDLTRRKLDKRLRRKLYFHCFSSIIESVKSRRSVRFRVNVAQEPRYRFSERVRKSLEYIIDI